MTQIEYLKQNDYKLLVEQITFIFYIFKILRNYKLLVEQITNTESRNVDKSNYKLLVEQITFILIIILL